MRGAWSVRGRFVVSQSTYLVLVLCCILNATIFVQWRTVRNGGLALHEIQESEDSTTDDVHMTPLSRRSVIEEGSSGLDHGTWTGTHWKKPEETAEKARTDDVRVYVHRYGNGGLRMKQAFNDTCRQRAGKDQWAINIGAHLGDFDPNTPVRLTTCSWNVLFVEPAPPIFGILETQARAMERQFGRPTFQRDVEFANVAVAARNGVLPFYYIVNAPANCPIWATQINSLSRDFLERAREKQCAAADIAVQDVRVVTPSALLEMFNVQPEQVSVILIDVEGFDGEVVAALPLGRLSPNLIVFERKHLSEEQLHTAIEHLIRHHYDCYTTRNDIVAIKRGATSIPDLPLG